MEKENKKLSPLEKFRKLKNNDDIVLLKDATEREGEYTKPFPVGYKTIDDAIKGGVREGDLIVGTGISGRGKTLLYQNISLNLSLDGYYCLWFSYELLIDNFYAKFKEMGCENKIKIVVPRKMTAGATDWIYNKVLEAIEKYKIKFVFIDHLDFLVPKNLRESDPSRIVIKEICTELKKMAIDLQIAIFLISHVKKVQGRAVEMQDLAESRATFQIADLVLVIDRTTCTEKIGDMKVEYFPDNTGTVRVLKNRISGIYPIMKFDVTNSKIIELESLEKEKKDENEIEIVE